MCTCVSVWDLVRILYFTRSAGGAPCAPRALDRVSRGNDDWVQCMSPTDLSQRFFFVCSMVTLLTRPIPTSFVRKLLPLTPRSTCAPAKNYHETLQATGHHHEIRIQNSRLQGCVKTSMVRPCIPPNPPSLPWQ